MLLCFFETPDWIARNSSANVTDPNGMYPRFDLPMLTDGPATALAAAALAMLVVDLALQVAFQGAAAFGSRGLQVAYAVAVALAAVEKYVASDGSARFQEDLGRYARQGGDAVKQLIEK